MLMLGFRGFAVTPDSPITADLRERNVGSVVLFNYDTILKAFTRNVESPAQLAALNRSLQALAATPLLISIDQEGGFVSRLTENNGFPATESQAYYGAKNDPTLTRAAAEQEGSVLKQAGINLNLAPVVDLALNADNPIIAKYERSFSADPAVVTANAAAAIEGYHAQGIRTTLKHFPGHGSSTSDSHLGFVDVTTTWQEIELDPYRELVRAGLADAVMTAHIFNANLDPKYPATLSKAVITGILREQLQYDGVVISDDMQMGAIRQYYGLEEAIELAILAGVDILAFANNTVYDPTIGARAFDIIRQLVENRKITEQRIDESYQRVMQLKARTF
jgi:beta-N-acetylhexosaminidase